MRELTVGEIQAVSGAGVGQTLGTAALTTGGAALGSYFGAARLGATLGAAAGPVGAFIGGLTGVTIAIIYYNPNLFHSY